MAAATSIMRAQQIVLSAVDGALKPLGLTFARWEALVLLSFSRTGALPLGKIGERLMVHPASITNTIDRLEEAGLVTRIPHDQDSRITLASITRKGRALAQRATHAVEAVEFGLEPLNNAELKKVTEIIRHLRAGKGEFREQ